MKKRTAYRILFGVLAASFAINMAAGSIQVVYLPLSFVLLIMTVITGVAFDIIGTAVAAATEPPINAVASRRIKGGAEALRLVRNAPQVANFCNDIVGDVCGTLSGALSASSSVSITLAFGINPALSLALTVAAVTTATVTLKYISKSFAIDRAEEVILVAGKVIAYFKGLVPAFLRGSENGRRR